MSGDVLSHWEKSLAQFEPRNIEGVAALYLARSFTDLERVRDYAHVVQLIGVRAAAEIFRSSGNDRGEGFLGRASAQVEHPVRGFQLAQVPVVALRIERRTVALAVFMGLELQYSQVRRLPASMDDAQTSTAGFVRWSLTHFPDGSVALECGEHEAATRSAELTRVARAIARESGTPVWDIPLTELFGLFREPRVRSRAQFRDAVAGIYPFPSLNRGERSLLDAIGLGLTVSLKRTFGEGDKGDEYEA